MVTTAQNRRFRVVRIEAVATNTHGTAGSQIRSTSPLDMAERSASATPASAEPESHQSLRSRSVDRPATAAGPIATENAARLEKAKNHCGRSLATPA